MKIKATRKEIRECVSNAVYRILREAEEYDNLDDVEANDREYYAQDEDDDISDIEPTDNQIEDTGDEFEGNDELIQQAMQNNETEYTDNGTTYSTDLSIDDDVDCQIMDELEEKFDAEIDDSTDPVTVTVDSSMVDRLEQYFQEHDIQANQEGGLNESIMRKIIRESIRKTLNEGMYDFTSTYTSDFDNGEERGSKAYAVVNNSKGPQPMDGWWGRGYYGALSLGRAKLNAENYGGTIYEITYDPSNIIDFRGDIKETLKTMRRSEVLKLRQEIKDTQETHIVTGRMDGDTVVINPRDILNIKPMQEDGEDY